MKQSWKELKEYVQGCQKKISEAGDYVNDYGRHVQKVYDSLLKKMQEIETEKDGK